MKRPHITALALPWVPRSTDVNAGRTRAPQPAVPIGALPRSFDIQPLDPHPPCLGRAAFTFSAPGVGYVPFGFRAPHHGNNQAREGRNGRTR